MQKENHKFGLIVDEVKSLMTVDQKNKIKVPMEVLSQNAKLDECIEEGVLAQDPSSNDSLNLIILNMDAVLGKVSELLDESLGSLKKKSASH